MNRGAMAKYGNTTAQSVLDAWDMFEEGEPDISTERLLALTADFCKCGVSDVVCVLSDYRSGV